MPDAVRDDGPFSMELTVEAYRSYWRKANENISCSPGALSFSTMKAGAKSEIIATIDCLLTWIPLKSGYVPSRWRKFVDVMIMKKAGFTHLSGLRTIVLFPVDCNSSILGDPCCKLQSKQKALAQEQYGSRKGHRAINLATNKSLTNDLL